MESPDRAEQGLDDLVKNKAAPGRGELDAICNGHGGEGDSKKNSLKRKTASSDENGDDVGNKKEHGRGEIPAHHARRPPNGFLLFCKRHRDIVSAKNPNLENRGVTKLLGNWWRTLEEEERDKYKELARQNKEIFIANNPQFTWYKLPAPPLRTLVTRPSNRRPPKLEPSLISNAGPITPGKLADESQLGGLTSLLSSSLSPPTTPLNTSPPSPTAITALAPPKKRYLLQTRASETGVEAQSLSESDETADGNSKKNFKMIKKKYKKKKNWNSLKYKKNLKMKWNESLSEKIYIENNGNTTEPWKSENGCTQQQLIEKIVDSSFDSQKPLQEFDVQRTLDYINTEHTYQKNPSRFWQHQKLPKEEKRESCILQKSDLSEENTISPNLNNNTIVLSSGLREDKNNYNYSFNDNNNLIIDYIDSNQRKLDQSSIQTNHDRIRTFKVEDGYIPVTKKKCVEETYEDCDNIKGSEDQKKPFQIAQVENDDDYEGDNGSDADDDADDDDDYEEDYNDEYEGIEEVEDGEKKLKNCDKRNANFQSILGKVSREIVSMIKERGPEDAEDMAIARFNVKSRSETDSDGSWDEKSDGSPPESPGGRRSKRSCKGQRYKQFIKDSVSKKRSKNSNVYSGIGDAGKKRGENRNKKRKLEQLEETETGVDEKINMENAPEFLSKEKEFSETLKENPELNSQKTEDLTTKQGTKASDMIQLKLDLESKSKVEVEGKNGRKHKDVKTSLKKKPVSKVQMIKEKRELHVGEFNLNEKIEELPLLSFESFLQKKRQRKKRLLGLKKDGFKSKFMKNKLEKLKGKSPNALDSNSVAPHKLPVNSGQVNSKPDFADLTTLAETALTLLSLREPR